MAAAKYARARVQLTGTTSSTATTTYATLDIRDLLPDSPDLWKSTAYFLEANHIGHEPNGDHASYGRRIVAKSNSSGTWTITTVASRYTSVESDSTWTISETATSYGLTLGGRGNTSSADTVSWMFEADLYAIKAT